MRSPTEPNRAIDWNWSTTVTWASDWDGQKLVYRSPDGPFVAGSNPPEPEPKALLSGMYYALLTRLDDLNPNNNTYSSIPFVIRNDAEPTDIIMQTADTTWHAYNYWGGKSLYHNKLTLNDINSRAPEVRYDRPYDVIPTALDEDRFTMMFLERNGYDVGYTTHVDVDRYYNEHGDAPGPGSLQQHKVYIVGGHDEYWSGEHVKALEAARMGGVSLVFMSGNEGFWKTRWSTDYQSLISYKETQNNTNLDPTDIWTGLFQDLRSGTPAGSYNPEYDLLQAENALTGTKFTVNFNGSINEHGVFTDAAYGARVVVPAGSSSFRFWRNTSVSANLNIPLGHEWDDDDSGKGFRPSGTVNLTKTDVQVLTKLQDFSQVPPGSSTILPKYGTHDANGNPTFQREPATHRMTMYRGSRNSLVFGAGLNTWSWGIVSEADAYDRTVTPNVLLERREDAAVKRATVNMLVDMGVPAPIEAWREPDLQGITFVASTDTTPPVSFVSKAKPQTGLPGVPLDVAVWTVNGTASDTGSPDARLAGVEISYDGGDTWHTASLINDPLYNWQFVVHRPIGEQPFFLSRAVDDSYNMEKVKATLHAGNLYVYGGSVGSGEWDNDLSLTKNGSSFTATNNGVSVEGSTIIVQPVGSEFHYSYQTGYSSAVTNLRVDLAVGTNRISIVDPSFSSSSRQNILDAATPTLSGSVWIFGGIGKDTVNLNKIRLDGGLTVKGHTGADTVNLKTSVVLGVTEIDARHNGNVTAGSALVGAGIKLQNSHFGGNLSINSGNANDSVTVKDIVGFGSRKVTTRAGNDSISRGVANQAVENLFELIGGHGDDTYAYARTSLSGDTITDIAGSDWLDLSAAPSGLGDFTIPTLFENIRGSAFPETIRGDARDNILEGNGGNDSLYGGAGNDTYAYTGKRFVDVRNSNAVEDICVIATPPDDRIGKIITCDLITEQAARGVFDLRRKRSDHSPLRG